MIVFIMLAIVLFLVGLLVGAKIYMSVFLKKAFEAYLERKTLEVKDKDTYYIFNVEKITKEEIYE